MKAAVINLQNIQERYYRENNITELDNSLFQRFTKLCTGPWQNRLKWSIYQRAVNSMEYRKKIRVIKPNEDVIVIKGVKDKTLRILPKEPVSEECQGKTKDGCKYPCFWHPHQKCYDQPVGIYRPGDIELETIHPDMNGEYDLSDYETEDVINNVDVDYDVESEPSVESY